jgi:hypothetical protein
LHHRLAIDTAATTTDTHTTTYKSTSTDHMPRLTKHFKRLAALRPHSRGDEARGKRRDSEDGQAMVEFALVLPIMVTVILALTMFGIFASDQHEQAHVAKVAARYAAVDSERGNGQIPESNPVKFLEWIKTEVAKGTAIQAKEVTAKICSPGAGEPKAPGSKIGSPVEVKIEYIYNWFESANWFGVKATTKIVKTAVERIAAEPLPGEAYPTEC